MKKKIIIPAILILTAAIVFAGYKYYNKPVRSLTHSSVDLQITAAALIKRFETDEGAANKEFLGKKLDYIITVSGPVKEVVKDERGAYTVVLGDSTNRSTVRCSIDSIQNPEAASLKKGGSISIKGAITGFMKDDLGIGSDVILNRCVID